MAKWLIFSGAALAVLTLYAPDAEANGNAVTRWNNQALDVVRTERLGAAGASRVYAMVNVAMYDAINAIDRRRHRSTRPQALVSGHGAPRFADRRAAASGAAHAVLTALYPNLSADYDALLASDLASYGSGHRVNNGVVYGAAIGTQVVTARANDGSSPGETLPGGTAPGQFRADFTSAQYRNMTPFAIADKTPYVTSGPPALTSREYEDAFNEVRLFGDRSYVNTDYDEIFRFWAGSGGSARPPGEWIKIALVVADQRGTDAILSRTARLFALLGMALADSTIVAWTGKFNHAFWRPATAIQNAGTDGNPNTIADPTWTQRNGSIGGSPEHTSGQSTYAGAGSTILASFYCTDSITFTFTGDSAIAGPRTFDSFQEAAQEAGRARIFAGIHFEFSNQAGLAGGRGIGREVAPSLARSGLAGFLPDCSPF